jgi:transposase
MKATEKAVPEAQEPRRRYDETFKRHAVELTLQGHRRVTQVAQELGVPESMVYAWRRQYAPRPAGSGERPRSLEEAETEIGRLRAEIVRLEERELVLKKSLGILSETPGRGLPRSRP